MNNDRIMERLEQYGGLIMLTTNLIDVINPAFTRHLPFHVPFARPRPTNASPCGASIYPPPCPWQLTSIWTASPHYQRPTL